MDVTIKALGKDSKEIKDVQDFLFKMIKKEFGYGYVAKWHQDIVKMEQYYINPKRNNFFVGYSQTGKIIATIGIRAYDKNFSEFKNLYTNKSTSSIWRLFVDEEYRRCGLASKMFSVSENFANESGYDKIYLHTHKTLDGALKFWTKMGFIVTLDMDDELETVHMDKKIQKMKIPTSTGVFQYALEL